MHLDPKILPVSFAGLSTVERLKWIDFPTMTIADLAYGVATDGDPDRVRTLLDINRMLDVMRDELVTSQTQASAEIIANAKGLTMKRLSRDRVMSATIH